MMDVNASEPNELSSDIAKIKADFAIWLAQVRAKGLNITEREAELMEIAFLAGSVSGTRSVRHMLFGPQEDETRGEGGK